MMLYFSKDLIGGAIGKNLSCCAGLVFNEQSVQKMVVVGSWYLLPNYVQDETFSNHFSVYCSVSNFLVISLAQKTYKEYIDKS